MQTIASIGDLIEGRTYRLQYRVLNRIGWSDFSPVLYVLVATKPEAPAKPALK